MGFFLAAAAAWRSEVPKKLIDQEDECEPRCRLAS
jgi:hypothetical protein